ncbi:3921_t:CDS:1, partial [Ambispora leptoticha]
RWSRYVYYWPVRIDPHVERNYGIHFVITEKLRNKKFIVTTVTVYESEPVTV